MTRLFMLGLFGAALLTGPDADATEATQAAGADAPAPARATKADEAAPVGLGLLFEDGKVNGGAAPLVLIAGPRRFLQEIDLVARATTADDRGLDPVTKSGDLAGLDWSGVTMVEELWEPEPTGTFTRQRYFRKARWMERGSSFSLSPLSAGGRPLGPPIIADVGAEAVTSPNDDFLVRRFVARQIARGCPSRGSCAGAKSFTAEALVQAREAQRAATRARALPRGTRRLELRWSADPRRARVVDVELREPGSERWGYGFRPRLELRSTPKRGGAFAPGDEIAVRLVFEDGQGRALTDGGLLPSYAEFRAGGTASGLRYRDGGLGPLLYYAWKKREGVMAVSLAGPSDRIRTVRTVVQMKTFMSPPAEMASAGRDGFTSFVQLYPPPPVEMAGPDAWRTPITDVATFKLPVDAKPGTYLVTLKARREFRGEPLNRGAVLEVQVGTATKSAFAPTTGNCESCHGGPKSLATVLHGIDDRRTCQSCHAPLFFEPDNAFDWRVHAVHSRSARFPKEAGCNVCHLGPTQGAALGWLADAPPAAAHVP